MRKLGGRLARSLAPEDLGTLSDLGRAAASRGFAAYLVGGAVRDALLGIPSRDLDVVVEGDVIALAELWRRERGASIVAHPRFRTASLSLPSGASLDLAEARREEYASPGALPSVSPSGLEADLARRDFTVNAMAARLDPGRFGELVDPLAGEKDLARRRVRILHAASFLDDPTRAYRAVGLCVRYGFRLEAETARRLDEAVRRRAAFGLSPHRLGREVAKLFAGARAERTVDCLEAAGLLPTIAPRQARPLVPRAALRRADRLLRGLGGQAAPLHAWTIPVAILASRGTTAERAALAARLAASRGAAAILVGGPDEARAVARRLGSVTRASHVERACRGLPVETLVLAAALSGSRTVSRSVRRYLGKLRFVAADVTGRDLVGSGVPAGPAIARGLDAALAAKLDGRARGREAQLRAALRAALRA
jgi:tRNA nucleotidyltransferase (CCA-adding enzyme)